MVLHLYETDMPTVSMMREGIEAERKKGRTGFEIKSINAITEKDLNEADVIIFIRPTNLVSYSIARCAKKRGVFLITFCDDDLYNIEASSALEKSRVKYFRKVLKLSNLILTCSPRIAEKYKGFTIDNRSVVQDTTVYENNIKPYEDSIGKVKIVYAAGADHSVLFEKYIAPVLDDIYDEVGDIFSLSFVGTHPEFQVRNDIEIEYIPMMSLEEYRAFMMNNHFDIGLAPLEDNEFSKCKYFNKYIEYSSNAIMGIYTQTEPYTYVVKEGENGLFAGFDSDSWKNAICNAIRDEKLRKKCVENSQHQLLSEFTEEQILNKYYAQIPEINSYQKSEERLMSTVQFRVVKVRYSAEKASLFAITSLQYVKENGFKLLWNKVKNHQEYKKSFK